MEAILDRSTTPAMMRLRGEVIIDHAAQLQERLGEALASGEAVLVDLAGITQVDVTGLQLLTAAEQAAEARGVAWERWGAVSESLQRTADEAGWERVPFAGEGVRRGR